MADDKQDAENMKELDAFFETARQHPPELPDMLRDRILARAIEVQDQIRPSASVLPFGGQPSAAGVLPLYRGWRVQIADLFGGWYGLGGLVAAGAAGVWLGFAPPSGLPDVAGVLTSGDALPDLIGTDIIAAALPEDI